MGVWYKKWLVLWSLWAARLVQQPTVTLELSNGPVRGTIAPDGSHAKYTSIPYATVIKRFQSPGAEPTWTSVFDAINENVKCSQSLAGIWKIGNENCLTLNVYTPLNLSPSSKLPVMVFIHGGGYFQGSGNTLLYGPKYLISKDVVLITINYRLRILGFACLHIKEAPGNAGMKDQVAALRWIQKNVRQFGGDPDNVTIFGESAGASSVSYHIYSPMSKGLFHKAITQSGSSLSPWSYMFRPVYIASLVAKVMLYESQDPYSLYKYFATKSDADLVLTRVPRQPGNVITSEILFTPCAEKIIQGEEQFLTSSPFDILTKGEYNHVPMMIGTNNEEGLLILGMDSDTMTQNITFENSLPKNLHLPNEKEKLDIVKILEQMYMDGEKISLETSIKLSRYIGEVNLNFPSLIETELLLNTNKQPIYNYLFQYSGKRNLASLTLPSRLKGVKGATHADDIFYLFSQEVITNFFEDKMIDQMSTMWTNFAKYGDPTPDFTNPPVKWYQTNSSTPTSLVIDSQFSSAPLFYNERVKYLREVYSKFRRKG